MKRKRNPHREVDTIIQFLLFLPALTFGRGHTSDVTLSPTMQQTRRCEINKSNETNLSASVLRIIHKVRIALNVHASFMLQFLVVQ